MTEVQAQTQTSAPNGIAREMTIGDVVKRFPQAAEVFLEYGLHCVGCHVSYWETIEEGARGHGMSEENFPRRGRPEDSLPEHRGRPPRSANLRALFPRLEPRSQGRSALYPAGVFRP